MKDFLIWAGVALGIYSVMMWIVFLAGGSSPRDLNNRIDRQRDFLCAKYADADATLRDCPKDTRAERIKALETELERLRGRQ